MSESRRLFRSRGNRVIAGVCGGLGEFFHLDPVIVRILWLLLILGFGTGILAYIICWLIIPNEPDRVTQRPFDDGMET